MRVSRCTFPWLGEISRSGDEHRSPTSSSPRPVAPARPFGPYLSSTAKHERSPAPALALLKSFILDFSPSSTEETDPSHTCVNSLHTVGFKKSSSIHSLKSVFKAIPILTVLVAFKILKSSFKERAVALPKRSSTSAWSLGGVFFIPSL